MNYSNKQFDKLAKGINLPFLYSMQDISIVNARIIDGIIHGTILFQRAPEIKDLLRLAYHIEKHAKHILKPSFEVLNYFQEQEIFKTYITGILSSFPRFAKINSILNENDIKYSYEKEKWLVSYNDANLKNEFEEAVKFLNANLSFFGLSRVMVEAFHNKIIIENTTNNNENINKIFAALRSEQKKDSLKKDFSNSTAKKFKGFSNRKYSPIEIHELKDYDDAQDLPVTFSGKIYKNEAIEKPNLKIYKYKITNEKDAISLTQFVFVDSEEKLLPVNSEVIVEGIYNPSNQSNYQNSKIVKVDKIIPTSFDKKEKIDEYPEKRVELNIKTNMNAMDGLLDPSAFVNIAKKFNHKALAIMDSVSCQSYPAFASAAKKAGIKPIYGVSFDVIDKGNMVFLTDFENQKISEASYVVFDLETTSLSPKIGDIIEFGASIIENGQIVDSVQFFIKPREKLSDFTINLTKITNEMVENGIEIEEALDRIFKILDNKVAVAHNANFDMHFLLQKFKDHNKKIPNTTFIDSLMISKMIFVDAKKHVLASFTKGFNIDYDPEVAHRADYDSDVLAKAFLKSIDKFAEYNILDFKSLSEYLPGGDQFLKKIIAHTNQVSVIAKNQSGLKELFKLVSLASTDRYFDGSKLFWDDLSKRENFLIGSGGIKGLLIDALLHSSDFEIDKIIDKFDYIEIPHPDAFIHKISTGDFTKKNIEFLLKDLIHRAKKKNKKVVVIGDVRFENVSDKIYYKSLVYAKGIGGASHFIFSYKNKEKLEIPDLSYKTTQEMLEQFSFLGDIDLIKEIVIENTNYIASQVEDKIQIIKDGLFTPEFDDSKNKLPELVYKTAKEKYGENLPEIIKERIEKELNPIIKYGFDVIYWISHILVKKSNDDGYLVGSRGSVGSSLVATLSGITEINPLNPHYICSSCKYFEMVENPPTSSGFDLDDKKCPKCGELLGKDGHSIPFETFLGFNADKVPDIDLNFSGDYQPTIHAEVRKLFGEDKTFRAGTISAIQEKTAYGYLKASVEDYKWNYSPDFIDYVSSKMIDVKRTTGQHPGGIIIIPQNMDIEDFTPINFPANDENSDWKTTHFDYRAIHDNVLKLDLLGHVDPTAIRMLERLTGLDVKKDIPSKDEDVISLFSSPKALNITSKDIGGEPTGAYGIPEFGTDFVRRMLAVAKPQSFSDLIAISGLSHGTDVWTGNAEKLISEEGMKLSEVISCRDDIMRFLIKHGVPNLDSFNIMEKVRKGKGLTPDEEKLLQEYNVPEWSIRSMKLIKYMFPRAHATAYVLMAWRIAWFKLYKPLEYYATFFTTRLSEFDVEILASKQKVLAKLDELKNKKDKSVSEKSLYTTLEIAREMYARGYGILNIDIEKSLESEWIIDYNKKSLIPPFTSIKGLGDSVAKKIIQSRNEEIFHTKEDFKRRSGINNTLYEEVNRLGILDELNEKDQMTLF
ncbi:DNA polymerase III PolC [Mycoplasmopsis canis UF31]|uniref:PolC-type DNA polymerase III n=1 Tax=Mycoplasmopsis canis TaxID=29555 RepID=UPI00025ADBFB|nr:PolC-type DNA polymerase III [Mycoplasmopsis canis]EIE41037.1 DNA polymerase III PolC [Mycoplasmopsis canis UF31]